MKYVVTRNPGAVRATRDFDRLLNSLWNDWCLPTTKAPSVYIWEEDTSYVLEAELPGYSEKDVDVHVDKHVLKISSLCEAEKEVKEEKVSPNYLIRERSCTSFERSFALPEGVDEEKIEGTFKNGVLTISIPKIPAKQPKKIDVKIK